MLMTSSVVSIDTALAQAANNQYQYTAMLAFIYKSHQHPLQQDKSEARLSVVS